MRLRIVLAIGVAVLITAPLSGCSTGIDGTGSPVSATSAATSGADVDVARLDTGTYQTEPSPSFGAATGQQIVEYEGQRMAEFVVVPFEIDPELTDSAAPTSIIRSRANLVNLVGRTAAFVSSNDRFVAGFVSSASTPTQKNNDPRRSINHMVLRYADAATASAAARQMHDGYRAQNKLPDAPLAGLPTTLGARTAAGGNATTTIQPSLAAFTPHNDYVIFTWASSPVGQEKWMDDTVRKALALEVPLIDRFPATPTRAQNGGKSPQVEVDQDRILVYALPNPNVNAVNGSDRAIYGPRGMAHISSAPATTYATLSAADSVHNAVWGSTVYRAATSDGASTIVTDFVNSDLTTNGYSRAAAPTGLPTASCVSRDTAAGQENLCYVAVGRYVGEVGDRDKKVADQKISAQYLILTKADPNAN